MKKLLFIALVVLVLTGCQKNEPTFSSTATVEPIKLSLLTFNIQIFGNTKLAKKEVFDILIDITKQYDIIAIQEVRDSSGDSVLKFMAALPQEYKYTLGPKEGRSNSKEQYLVVYNSTKINLEGVYVYPDVDDVFERNPYSVHLKSIYGNFDFILIDNHISPNDAKREIAMLPIVFEDAREYFSDQDVVAVGDFNSDGNYFKEKTLLTIFPQSDYTVVTTNDLDTTVAPASNTYDRIVLTSSLAKNWVGNVGVLRFDEVYDFSKLTIQPKEVSDHYPVWTEFLVQ